MPTVCMNKGCRLSKTGVSDGTSLCWPCTPKSQGLPLVTQHHLFKQWPTLHAKGKPSPRAEAGCHEKSSGLAKQKSSGRQDKLRPQGWLHGCMGTIAIYSEMAILLSKSHINSLKPNHKWYKLGPCANRNPSRGES